MAVHSAHSVAQEGKYLTFVLGDEEYGLEILKVQEINKMMDVTPVPQSPPYVRGVINLRGRVIPIISLREHFRMARAVDTEKTCTIVVQAQYEQTEITLGLIVDEVSEVVSISREQIDAAPQFGGGMEAADFVRGMGKLDDKVVILLDIDAVVAKTDLLDLVDTVPA